MSLLAVAIDVLAVIGLSLGALFVWFPSAVLLGGGGNSGEEAFIIGQMFVGFLLLIGILWGYVL